VFLAASGARPFAARRRWRDGFIQTFLERDIRKFGVEVPPDVLRRLWTRLAHYHGQIWNASELARSRGEAHTTVKRHLDILCDAVRGRTRFAGLRAGPPDWVRAPSGRSARTGAGAMVRARQTRRW